MKPMTDDERSVPLTISIPKYAYTWMKQNLAHGEASKIMSDEITRRISEKKLIENLKANAKTYSTVMNTSNEYKG